MKVCKFVVILSFISVFFILFYTGALRYSVVKNNVGNRILVQRSWVLKNSPNCLRARKWLSQRWSINEVDIYLIVKDKEPWMDVCGFLDIQSLKSGLIFVYDESHEQGYGWISTHEKWGTPHNENMYAIFEFKPDNLKEKSLSVKFYSRPNFWEENLLGDLSIIQNITWIDAIQKNGTIFTYQSEEILPSVTTPIVNGRLRLWSSNPTPLGT